MPRTRRHSLPGVALHVIQRGNNRQLCFFNETDYKFYLKSLFDFATLCEVEIHAFVLMTNHVHLLVTPAVKHGVSRMMQRLGAKYVANINRLHQRTGTLWEGRFKSSLVDSHEYCLACYRYIELNPVRAGIVNHPAEYPWTSYRSNTGLEFSSSISPHPQWLALGQSDRQRFSAYESLVAQALSEDKIEQIRYNVSKGLPTGSRRFKAEVESALAIKLGDGKRGRPWIKVDKGVRAL